jgi:hypothetical protein
MVAGNKSCVLLESCFGVQMFGPGEVVVCYVLPWQVVMLPCLLIMWTQNIGLEQDPGLQCCS